MTSAVAKPHQIDEIAGLAASIAARIIEKQVEGVPIPPELFRHLVKAAQILMDNEVSWPPSVELIVTEVSRRVLVDQLLIEWAAGQSDSKPSRPEAIREALAEHLKAKGYAK